jgi:hypothetical protein
VEWFQTDSFSRFCVVLTLGGFALKFLLLRFEMHYSLTPLGDLVMLRHGFEKGFERGDLLRDRGLGDDIRATTAGGQLNLARIT